MTGNIEKYGSGLIRIENELKNYDVKFDFSEISNGFLSIFEKTTQKTTQKIITLMKENPNISRRKLLDILSKLVGSKLVEKVGSKLVETQLKIILLITEKSSITKKELSEIIGISTTAIDKNLSKLKRLRIIKRVGPDKGGHWEIIKE